MKAESTKTIKMNTASAVTRDSKWIQDPINYEVTKKPVINGNISVPILMYHEAKYTHKSAPNRKMKYPKLTIPEITTLQRSGGIDIESHTVNHLNLSTVSVSSTNYQLKESAAQISNMTGHRTLFFCYPDGGYRVTDVDLVGKNGYLMATTMRQGYANISEGPLTLDRIGIYSYTTLTEFATLLSPSLHS